MGKTQVLFNGENVLRQNILLILGFNVNLTNARIKNE